MAHDMDTPWLAKPSSDVGFPSVYAVNTIG